MVEYASIAQKNKTMYNNRNNTIMFATEYQGLGLPFAQYRQFANLLNIASNHQAFCTGDFNQNCILQQSCSVYLDMFNEYSFMLKFPASDYTSNNEWFIIPLASFARDNLDGQCEIFVQQNVDTGLTYQSSSIWAGLMFF